MHFPMVIFTTDKFSTKEGYDFHFKKRESDFPVSIIPKIGISEIDG